MFTTLSLASLVALAGCPCYDYYDDDCYCDSSGCYCCDVYGCYQEDECSSDWDCSSGNRCDFSSGYGVCVADGACQSDIQCADGYVCSGGACEPCTDETCDQLDPGQCYAEVTCSEPALECPNGTHAGVLDGCYTGYCIPDELCPDEAPVVCRLIETQEACAAETSCRPVVGGTDCTYPQDNSPCEAGVPGCVCQSVGFIFCDDRS